ncbi:allene oxide cyclase barrel-like domain-containing protein [Amycolatopsis sp. CA-126428]|uniref:allene oxide cyclase barrel-like domain-containing protein n=1 Tax=Amycolatopsis sp. CA-126428 TaxID=2073158 RepID=UPI000CD1B141|nr:hypothetical protein [Amycolatopsis sp. CA-126428]
MLVRRIVPPVLLSAALTLAAASGVPGSAAPQVSEGCVVIDNLSETIVDGTENELGGPFPSVGDSGTYLDRLYDPAGKPAGTVYGLINVPFALPGGDLIEHSDERIELPEGTIEAAGLFNVTQAERKVWQFLPLVGTGGRYQGMVGKRHFQILEFRHSLNARIEMCPAGKAP